MKFLSKMKIDRKMLIAYTISTTIIISCLSYLAITNSKEFLAKEIGLNYENQAIGTIDKIDRSLFERYGDVQAFVSTPISKRFLLGEPVQQQLLQTMNNFTVTYGIYDAMFLVDKQGKIVASNSIKIDGSNLEKSAQFIGKNVSSSEWFSKCLDGTIQKGFSYFSEPYIDSDLSAVYGSKKYVMSFAAPVFDDNNQIIGVWVNFANMSAVVNNITKAVTDFNRQKGLKSYQVNLFNNNGTLLTDDFDESLVQSLNLKGKLACLDSAMNKKDGFTTGQSPLSNEKQVFGYAYSRGSGTYKGNGWVCVIREDEDEAFADIHQITYILLISGIVLNVLMLILTYFFSKSISNGFKNFASYLDVITNNVISGKLETRCDIDALSIDYTNALTNTNNLIEAFVQPMSITASYIDRISKGDLPQPIKEHYKGDFELFKNNINSLILNLNYLQDQVNYMSKEHDLGDIDVVIDTTKLMGSWALMGDSINDMVAAHINTKKSAIRVFEEFGNGNFSEDLPLLPRKKVFINHTINSVRNNLVSFDTEIKQIIENVTNGNLTIRANTEKFQGGWRELLEGVNEIVNQIILPVNESGLVLESLAEGDLTVRMKGKYKGEFDTLKQNINNLAKSLENVITQFSDSINDTANSAIQIATTAESMASATQEISSQAVEVASAMEEMSSTVSSNSMSAKNTANVAAKNGMIAKDGGEVVELTIHKMKDIASAVKETSEKITKLGRSSVQIKEIVSVINDIADQTNMLALNAAIEAARAGQQGRGFAVVADEVRKLAERTTNATKQIAEMIAGIQTDTESAVKVMEIGTKEVGLGIDLADKASHSLSDIVQSSNEVHELVTVIANASEEQTTTSQQISLNISTISEVLNEAANGVTEVATSAEELTKITINLRELVSNFKISKDDGDQMITEYHGKSINSFRNRALNGN